MTMGVNLDRHYWSSGYHTADPSSPPPGTLALLSLLRRGRDSLGTGAARGAEHPDALPPTMKRWYPHARRIHNRVTVGGPRNFLSCMVCRWRVNKYLLPEWCSGAHRMCIGAAYIHIGRSKDPSPIPFIKGREIQYRMTVCMSKGIHRSWSPSK